MDWQTKRRLSAVLRPLQFGLQIALVVVSIPSALAQFEPAGHQLDMGLDLSFIKAEGHPSWLEGSAGKLRYDSDNDGLLISRGFIDYDYRVADTLTASVNAELYLEDFSSTLDLTEAYLEWRPVPRSENRYQLKFGVFYPRVSLENSGPGWSSPYTLSSSAINTWVGEELRAYGAEFSYSRKPESLGGMHKFSLHASMFYNNDTAGGLIAWKGWSVHDRQSRLGDEVPLPPIPMIQPGGWFDEQDPFITPILEIDDTYGYYVDAEWSVSNRFLVRVTHYDNRTDPFGYKDGQFAWETGFDQLALKATLPGDVGLIAQWMDGYTLWGQMTNGIHAVDVGFESHFVLLTRSFERHRISARYDDFEITERDSIPLDENKEDGHAWTVSYRYELNPNAAVAAEWLQIFSNRPAWAYFNLTERKTEQQLQLTLQLRFGRR
ncbi:MAG: hypothetical protein OEW73_09145 [Gammaproteobacteria bacterium]|nr:hypothetical protein [Gammaproteobacteria bacterium]MDH5240935.1 hypothetical protein [Gammaproteobacteria bacterium]MDH5583328.1 hypothetical protein [Gammaproteobacteria bacterium]